MFCQTPQDYIRLTDHQSGGPGLPLERKKQYKITVQSSLRHFFLPLPHLLTDGDNLTQKWHPDLG